MLTTLDIVVYTIGAALLVFWLVLFFVGKKHASLFDPLDEKTFMLKEIYFVGYALLGMIGYRYKTKHDRKLRKEIGVLFGEKYAEYYLRVIHAQSLTISLTVLILGFALYGFAADILMLGIAALLAVVFYYYFATLTEKQIKKRSEEMLRDFANVVSKLALMTNAGMILRDAWIDVAYSGQSTIYQEMQRSVEEMKNGVSEVDAIHHFGMRCVIPEIKKFTATIVQGMSKGNSELTGMLQLQSREVWNIKKQDVRRQGEKAANKLMVPILVMFIGILIMVMVPIFANLGI